MTIQTSQPVADRVAPGRVTKRLPAKPSFKGSVPADVKPWVRDAKSWEPPAISLSICIGAKVEDVFVSPLIRFKSIKAFIALHHYPDKGPGSLILMFDGKRLKDHECPLKHEMEDEDQIDCHYDPNYIDFGG